MNNNIIKIKRENGKVVAGLVTSAFLRKANVFGTPEFQMIEEFIEKYPTAEVKTICQSKATPVKEKKIRPTYQQMYDFISTQDNAESYFSEMDKIRKMAAISGNAYNTVVKWFNNTFENTADYKMAFIGDIENKPEEMANIELVEAA